MNRHQLFRWIVILFCLPCIAVAQGEKKDRTAKSPRLGPLGLERLMDIGVTSVTGQQRALGETPAAVAVITQEDIRRSGASTIPELFRRVPGMNVARIDANKWAVSARGFNDRFANKLLVQIDGRTLYNPIFSGVYWDAVDYPLEDIERIEVIRSPGGSVWGINAVNGIINIITKPSHRTQSGLLSGGSGVSERGFATVRYGDTLAGNATYRVFAKGMDQNKQHSDLIDPNDRWWNATTGVRIDWKPVPNVTGTLDAGITRSVTGRSDFRPVLFRPFYVPNLEDERTDNGHLLARWGNASTESTGWSLQGFWERFKRTGTNGYLDVAYDRFAVNFQHQFGLNTRNILSYGLEYRFVDAFLGSSRRDQGFAISFLPAHRRRQIANVSLQDIFTLLPGRLQVMAGAKLESIDFNEVELQPVGRVLWTPPNRQAVWFAVSRAVRFPNLAEEGLRLTLAPIPLTSPPYYFGTVEFPQLRMRGDLQSEDLIAFELGYRFQPAGQLMFDAAVFHNVYTNLRVFRVGTREATRDSTIFLLPLWIRNGMDGRSIGGEVSGQWQVTPWWRLYGAYTYIDVKFTRHAGVPAIAEAAAGRTPRNQVYVQSSWSPGGGWEFDLIGRFVDHVSGLNARGFTSLPNATDAYSAIDVRTAWRPKEDVELSLSGQNLLDRFHPEAAGNSFLETRLIEIRRSVYAKVTVWF